MGKRQLVLTCISCDVPLRSDGPFCEHCGRPTPWATHEERVAWEVRQWRASRAREGGSGSTQMMLVRTDEGYIPAPARPATGYVWDQPLHSERETTQRANPHAATRPTPAATTPAVAPAVEALAPAPVVPATEVAAAEAPPASPAPATRPSAPVTREEQVTVSKKAVAVGIALALGLPFSGKLISFGRATPKAKQVTQAQSGEVVPLPRGLTARAGFTQVSPDAARFAVVIRNPNGKLNAKSVTVTISLLDRAGRLIGEDLERVAFVPAGGKVAVAGQTGAAGVVASIAARATVARFEGAPPDRSFVVRKVRMSHSHGDLIVRASIASAHAARGVRVVVVHLDRAGRILGGDFAFVDVPAARAADVVITTSGTGRVARVLIYAIPAR